MAPLERVYTALKLMREDVKKEFFRKTLHLGTLLIPLAAFFSMRATQIILLATMAFYAFAEWKKQKGQGGFAQGFIRKAQRDHEKHAFAKAPLLLAAGVLIAISFYSWKAMVVGVVQAGLSDTLASLIGKQWGVRKVFFSPDKTYVGSVAYFVSALAGALFIFPLLPALGLSLLGTFLELLPLKDWDNFTIPVVVGGVAHFLLL